MSFIEYHEKIKDALPNLKLEKSYITGYEDYNYEAKNLKSLRKTINLIEDIPYITQEIKEIKKSWLFKESSNNEKINYIQTSEIENPLNIINIKLETFKQIAESSKVFNNDSVILIKIPEIKSFDNLSKYATDFKKAIELPIIDENVGGEVTILSADEGSIILYISLATVAAVKLIGSICWAAAVIKKKNAEAKIFEQYAKTLEIKNDSLENLVSAQKEQYKNILSAEAESIANNSYNHKEPETIERLKLSITTIADLMDKGILVLPASDNNDVQKNFPDYNNLNLIESSIRQITNN
ncbi:hypothetical protein HZP39_07525 [Elizabethkingia anophelis]|uniref:hypothetical protein n=1 Tax=Elizabethkingia anophelis TaxID=1117645 RepID=UPI00077E4D25|nr:hypothetical protein [Elizabethkingia anophelis]AMR42730.1 hypothetical protein A2T74_15825 [Elizabethkingia anophelis]AMX49373.1 hypothetical protein A4C56_15825 [Elizabethkingia anophelis]AMX52828.1 hypothetical protein A2T72_15820 [Elizabethkingia anophelis]AMX56222.1 hypothetical protein A2T59_15825 [Elizabethkingia anophelis]EGT4347023.1 hypothetical protein [Elizabethkingia anophelis]